MAMSYEEGAIRTEDGLRLYCRREIPDQVKAIVVLFHSLAEYCGRYDGAVAEFNASGYGVVRFDYRGHGRSEGARGDLFRFHDYLCDTDRVVEYVRGEYPGLPVFLVGHSMGGFVAAAYAAEHPDKLTGEVTAGAAVQLPPFLEFLKGDMTERERGDNRFAVLMPEWKTENGYFPDDDELMLDSITVRLAGNVWLYGADWFVHRADRIVTPFLAVHGEKDALIPATSSQWLFDHVSSPDRSIRFYPGGGHILLQDKGEALDDVIRWLDAHAPAVEEAPGGTRRFRF